MTIACNGKQSNNIWRQSSTVSVELSFYSYITNGKSGLIFIKKKKKKKKSNTQTYVPRYIWTIKMIFTGFVLLKITVKNILGTPFVALVQLLISSHIKS